jgi:hypothetical protein
MFRSRVILPMVALLAVAGGGVAACGSSERSAAAPAASAEPSGPGDAPVAAEAAPVPPRVRWQSAAHGIVMSMRPGQNSAPVTAFEAVVAPAMGQAPADDAEVTTCQATASTSETECTVGARSGQHEVWVRAVNGASSSPWLVVTAKAAPGKCTSTDVSLGYCGVGDTGPGGGFVFYDAGSDQAWGRYLEAAPAGWSGAAEDPEKVWCPEGSPGFSENRPQDKEIGAGAANTRVIIEDCGSDTAAGLAASYGDPADGWYLPTLYEARAMMKFADQLAITKPGSYWTSSQYPVWSKVRERYVTGYAFTDEYFSQHGKESTYFVRPIRAF